MGGAGENAVGFSEIALGDLDLSEFVQVPDDLFRAADRSPALARELERAPLRYLFERAQGEGLVDTERALRRRFRTAGTRSYLLSGTLVVDEETPTRWSTCSPVRLWVQLLATKDPALAPEGS